MATDPNPPRPSAGADDEPARKDPFAPLAPPGGGMTGSAPANLFKPPFHREQQTLAPDGRPAGQKEAWWRDFPIDWLQDHYVARRDFTKFMVLTSFAFVVGQFWIGFQNYFRRRRGRPAIAKIASLSAVPVGGTVTFNYPAPHDICILVRPAENALLAYSQKCTHLSCAVIPRPDEKVIHCPCHNGFFELATGRPIAGPPRRPLPRITLKVQGNDIYATGVEVSTI